MLSSLRVLKSLVWSNWKSMAQTWPGCVARSLVPSVTEVADPGALLGLLHDAKPLVTAQSLDPLCGSRSSPPGAGSSSCGDSRNGGGPGPALGAGSAAAPVVDRDGDLIKLNVEALRSEQRAELIVLCEQRLGEFVKRRGMATWDYRLIESDPVPTDVRYRVLTAANGRCALCGATSKERRIEVNHGHVRTRGVTTTTTSIFGSCSN